MSTLVMRIDRISGNVTEQHLRELLKPFGTVSKIRCSAPQLWLNNPTGRAEVFFTSENDAVNAFAHCQGAVVDGSMIDISFVRIAQTDDKESRRDREVSKGDQRYSRGRRSRSRDRAPPRDSDKKRRVESPPARRMDRRARSPEKSRRRRSPTPRQSSRTSSRSSSSSRRSSSGSPAWD